MRVSAIIRALVARLRGRNENAVPARELTTMERALLTRQALAASSRAFERDRIPFIFNPRG
jgi:hypothetical protein